MPLTTLIDIFYPVKPQHKNTEEVVAEQGKDEDPCEFKAGEVIKVDEDETDYRMEVDVSYYYPRAISVYTYKNILITHGYYLKDSDWWCDSDRRYIHAYTLPSNTIINTLEVDIKNDGILCISAKKDTRRNHILTIVLDNFYREKPIQYPDTHCSLLTASFHVFLLLLELSNMIWPF